MNAITAPAATAAPAAPDAAAVAAAAALAAKPTGADAELLIGEDAAAKPAALEVEPKGAAVIEFNPTGSAALDLGLAFVGKLGIGPGDAAFDAAANGDFVMLKAKLGQLGDKAVGHENVVALLEQEYKKGAAENASKQASITQAIYDSVGGKEQWGSIQKWASENAEPAEKASVNAALKAGGVQAKAMAQWLAGKYAKASGTTIEPAEVAPEAGRAPNGPTGALTAKAYAAECMQARAKLGYAFDTSPAYAALQARRLAGQRAGI